MKLHPFTLVNLFLLATLLISGVAPQAAVQAQHSPDLSGSTTASLPVSVQAPVAPAPHPILSDVQVRKAIAYCTDKDALIASVYPALTPAERQALVMDSFIPTTSWAYTAPATTYPYNPTVGRNLLNNAGWTLPGGADYRTKNGKELVLILNASISTFRETFLTVFENQMKACGIHVIRDHSLAIYSVFTGRAFELAEFAYISESDPDGDYIYACDQIPSPTNNWSGQNEMGWCNQAASDAIVQASNTLLSQSERKPYYATFINLFAEDVPSLPLFTRQGGTPDWYVWEHIDFNLQTFTQETDITPVAETILNYTDFSGNQGTVEVPIGAVTQTITLGYTPLVVNTNPPPTNQQVAIAFRLVASLSGVPQNNFLFSKPITITVRYTDADIFNIFDENSLVLDYWDGASWQDASTTCSSADQYKHLDTAQNLVEVNICHLTEFGLFGTQNHRVYLPVIIR
jgi:ABC-type transport system substrate-binding protein